MQDEENNNNQPTPSEIDDVMKNLPEDVIKNIPEEVRERMVREIRSISVSTGVRRSVPFENIMTPEHLSEIIKNADKDSERELENEKLNKKYLFLIFLISLVFIIVLILILIDKNPDILLGIMSHLGAAILGIAGGYGLKCKQNGIE